MTVVTRFAPSPTGILHLGSARTALFNWLYARHHGGRYLLRVEDTDRKRSTPEALTAILEGLEWLGLMWDGDVFYQSQQLDRHAEIAHALLRNGHAYYCFATPEELAEMRARARAEGRTIRYDGHWRDRDPSDAPTGLKPVIRLKSPQQGETIIDDQVQGTVRVSNDQLDDMILLRADGTPTYMLSVVVDDHDEGITHIIRGDDHLTNAARQSQLYSAMNWTIPIFAHISLIHAVDGVKLSKRHGATGVGEFREMGYLPDALINYLLRLGWAHGDDEIINRQKAIEWFDFSGVGQSPARFDIAKLDNLNSHYLRETADIDLLDMVYVQLTTQLEREISDVEQQRVAKGLTELKKRARTIKELVSNAQFYVEPPRYPLTDAKAAKLLNVDTSGLLTSAKEALATVEDWSSSSLEKNLRSVAVDMGLRFGTIAQPLRAAVTGMYVSPGIFEVIEILGREETLSRIDRAADSIS